MFKMLHVGTVPLFKIHNVETRAAQYLSWLQANNKLATRSYAYALNQNTPKIKYQTITK